MSALFSPPATRVARCDADFGGLAPPWASPIGLAGMAAESSPMQAFKQCVILSDHLTRSEKRKLHAAFKGINEPMSNETRRINMDEADAKDVLKVVGKTVTRRAAKRAAEEAAREAAQERAHLRIGAKRAAARREIAARPVKMHRSVDNCMHVARW